MKLKIILLLLMFLGIGILNVKAYTYSEWSEEYPEGYDSILIESEVRYKWYKESEIDIEYLSKSDFGDKKYDLNDFKYTIESEYSLEKPEEKDDREITTSVMQYTFTEDDINHILFKDFSFIGALYASEIDIFEKSTNKQINYEFESIYNDIYHTEILNDDNLDTYMPINIQSKILMNLGKKYNASNLLVKIYYKTDGTDSKSYKNMLTYNMVEGLIYKTARLGVCPTGCAFSMSYDASYAVNLTQSVTMYSFKDKIYKTYNINKEYLDDYLNNAEGYIKDESDYKTFYRYITSSYILTDLSGNLIDRDTNSYCEKYPCFMKYVKKKSKYPLQQLKLLIQKQLMISTSM